jgi:hypothetical protein
MDKIPLCHGISAPLSQGFERPEDPKANHRAGIGQSSSIHISGYVLLKVQRQRMVMSTET